MIDGKEFFKCVAMNGNQWDFFGWLRFNVFWWAMEHSPKFAAPYLLGAAIGHWPHKEKQ